MERIIIEMDKSNNEVVCTPFASFVDISTMERTTISYDDLVTDLTEEKNTYYRPIVDHVGGVKNQKTGETVDGKGFEVEKVTLHDIHKYQDEKLVFFE